MTNLIEKVAELRELATTDIPGKYATDLPEYKYMVEVLNAAPGLLDALGKIQAGDAKRLAGLIRWQTINDECSQDEIDMLDRLHEMACKMEANHE